MAASQEKHPERVIAGLKAAIHNPNVSEQAKERAKERLAEMGETEEMETGPSMRRSSSGGPAENPRIIGGYKATLKSDRTSEEAKAHAREVLEASGYSVERPADMTQEEHEKRVMAGYKAALRNPRVSDEAKQHARQYLEEHGAMM